MGASNINLININQIECACRDVAAEPHVEWWDNFSKTYAASMHHVDVGSYRDCQWTGRAVIDVLGQNDDMRISRLGAMTAMPKNLFSQAQRRRFVNIFRSMEANEAEWRQGSVCVMY